MDEKLTNRMDEFFKMIVEQVNEMIPVVWNSFYLFGELADDSSGGVVYFYFDEDVNKNEYIYYLDIPDKYNIPKDEFDKKSSLLFDMVYDLKEIFIDNELKLWQTIVVNVNENMKLIINFDYWLYKMVWKWIYSPIKRHEEYYCYKYLRKIPKDKEQEKFFKEMREYQNKFNK